MLIRTERLARVVYNDEDVDPREDGSIAIVLGTQSLPADADLSAMYDVGIRIVSLAYDGTCAYGSGCMNLDVGLTLFGVETIRAMSELGLILDLSHVSHRTAWEALNLIDDEQLPIGVMASHSGCYDIYPHFRNLPDSILRRIADRGGVIGIPTLGFILHEEIYGMRQHAIDRDAFVRHFRHALNVCGVDAITIGSDGTYTDADDEQGLKHFEMIRKQIDPHGTWGARYPDHPACFTGPKKLSAIRSFITFGSKLPAAQFDRIMGDNLSRFLKEHLPHYTMAA